MQIMETTPDTITAAATSSAEIKPRVLIIDDSRLVRVSIKKVLMEEFDILEAVDGEDGWDKLVQDPQVQVVITDQGMPKLDGFDLIKRIRANDTARINEIPIMMVTGAEKEHTHLREKALNLGATDFITKPFDKTQLLARARSHAKLDQTKRSLGETEDALSEQSATDTLTGLHNQRYFKQRGEQAISFANRHTQELSLFTIEVDKFEEITPTYGQETANQIVIWVADIIKDTLRKEDTLARIDRSRYAILIPTAGRMEAAVLCERIRKRIAETEYNKTVISLKLTVSIGLSTLGRDRSKNINEFCGFAENRLNYALQSGGNRVVASDQKAAPLQPPAKKKLLSLDSVMKVFRSGKVELLYPHLNDIAGNLIPLLELCNKKLNWGLDVEIERIKNKIQH